MHTPPARIRRKRRDPRQQEGTMIWPNPRHYRHWLAYLGFVYAVIDEVETSERIRGLVRHLDRSFPFRLESLN